MKNIIHKFSVSLSYFLIIFLCQAETIQAAENDSVQLVGQRYQLQSKRLNEKRTYSVYLPSSYKDNPNKRYIVAYVLDGDRTKLFEVAGIAQSMHSAFHLKLQIPELIIVAIENTDRTRDFSPTNSLNYMDKEDITAFKNSGKANDFMYFIEKELMPEINRSFRTVPQNMIIGHSLGGLFALHCFLENPNLFTYYLLIDPSWFWDHNYIGKRGKEILNKRNDLKARIFIGLANNLLDDKRHYQWGLEFFQLLKENKSPHLNVDFRYFEEEKHLTVTIPATYFGLKSIFLPYEININEATMDPSILLGYSETVKRELFLDEKPDERFINTMGYVALHERKLPDVAIPIFELNTKNYPLSMNVWDSLADAYLAKGDVEKARNCYLKILKLAPNDSNTKKKLEQLSK